MPLVQMADLIAGQFARRDERKHATMTSVLDWMMEMNRKLFPSDDPDFVFTNWLYNNIDDLPGAAEKLGVTVEEGPDFVYRLKAAVLPLLILTKDEP